MAADPQHDRLLSMITNLPGAYEDRPWGSVHCKVDGKIFVGWGRDDDGIMSIGIRVDLDQQAALVKSDRRFSIARYVGKYGGVDMRIGATPDWAEVEHFVVQSYRIIASKKRVKELDALLAAGSTSPPASKKKPPAPKKKPAAKKKPAKTARR